MDEDPKEARRRQEELDRKIREADKMQARRQKASERQVARNTARQGLAASGLTGHPEFDEVEHETGHVHTAGGRPRAGAVVVPETQEEPVDLELPAEAADASFPSDEDRLRAESNISMYRDSGVPPSGPDKSKDLPDL